MKHLTVDRLPLVTVQLEVVRRSVSGPSNLKVVHSNHPIIGQLPQMETLSCSQLHQENYVQFCFTVEETKSTNEDEAARYEVLPIYV